MFGAVVSTFFEYILGIRAEDAGQKNLVIAPVLLDALSFAKGYTTVPAGKVGVAYEVKDGKITLDVELPEGVTAKVRLPDGTECALVGPVAQRVCAESTEAAV